MGVLRIIIYIYCFIFVILTRRPYTLRYSDEIGETCCRTLFLLLKQQEVLYTLLKHENPSLSVVRVLF